MRVDQVGLKPRVFGMRQRFVAKIGKPLRIIRIIAVLVAVKSRAVEILLVRDKVCGDPFANFFCVNAR